MSGTAVEVVLSVTLGLIFGTSAIPKMRHPKPFVLAILEYRVLPPHLSRYYARLVPPLEFLTALLLLTGTAVRLAGVVISVLLLSFITAIGINMARGRELDCHCFGKATKRLIGWSLLLQDGAMLAAAIVVAAMASEWIGPEAWAPFRLSGLARAGSPLPFLVCVVVAAVTAALLTGAVHERRYRNAIASK